jgi:hypothetical protein
MGTVTNLSPNVLVLDRTLQPTFRVTDVALTCWDIADSDRKRSLDDDEMPAPETAAPRWEETMRNSF